jgi:predicted lipoprotein
MRHYGEEKRNSYWPGTQIDTASSSRNRNYASGPNSTKTADAKQAYQDFFNTWKDADPNLLQLLQAKTELSALK